MNKQNSRQPRLRRRRWQRQETINLPTDRPTHSSSQIHATKPIEYVQSNNNRNLISKIQAESFVVVCPVALPLSIVNRAFRSFLCTIFTINSNIGSKQTNQTQTVIVVVSLAICLNIYSFALCKARSAFSFALPTITARASHITFYSQLQHTYFWSLYSQNERIDGKNRIYKKQTYTQ